MTSGNSDLPTLSLDPFAEDFLADPFAHHGPL